MHAFNNYPIMILKHVIHRIGALTSCWFGGNQKPSKRCYVLKGCLFPFWIHIKDNPLRRGSSVLVIGGIEEGRKEQRRTGEGRERKGNLTCTMFSAIIYLAPSFVCLCSIQDLPRKRDHNPQSCKMKQSSAEERTLIISVICG